MTEIQSSFDDFLRDGGYDGPPEEQRDPFIAQLNISEPLSVIKAIEEFGGFDNVKDEEGIVEVIQHQQMAVVDAEKDLCPEGEFYQRFVPVAAVKDKWFGTIVLHRSLNQDDNDEVFGDLVYLTRVEDGMKAVGMARFNLTVEDGEMVVIDTYESKGNPFKRKPVRYRGSREMLSLLGKFFRGPKISKHLIAAYRCLLRANRLPGDSFDEDTQEVLDVDYLTQNAQPTLTYDVETSDQDFLSLPPEDEYVFEPFPLEDYNTASKRVEGGIISKTIEYMKSLDLKIPSLTIEERDEIIKEVARNEGFQKLIIRNFKDFKERINKQIEEVDLAERFIARGRAEEKEYIPLIATYINHEDGMFILHRSIAYNGWGNTYYLTRLVKGEYKDFIDLIKFTVSENDDPNSPLYVETIDFEEMTVPRYSCPPEIRKEILDLVNTKSPDVWKLKDLYNLM